MYYRTYSTSIFFIIYTLYLYLRIARLNTKKACLTHAPSNSTGRLEKHKVAHSLRMQRVRSSNSRHSAAQNEHICAI